ncbi:MAG: SufD family Fe-S cluster assembly protein [Candidatus Methanomethylophilaceae archaeon]|nr:SufD family Fe-S cluster assembly protein [Candidatus Methanomethylophilaceae archaeon]
MPIDESVKKALNKKGTYGKDIDLEKYDEADKDSDQIDDLESTKYKEYMEHVGVVADEMARSGTLMFINNGLSHCSPKVQEGLELMTVSEALKVHQGLKNFMWKAMDPEKDKYTAKTYLEDGDGFFIRVKPGYHIQSPMQTCMLLNQDKAIQNIHNIIIVEDGASLEMITGCSTTRHANDALHVGVTEIYIGDNANLTYSMIHSWGDKTNVRPRTRTVVGKNSNYTNNYVILNPVGDLQSFPVSDLSEGASTTFNTMCIAHAGSNIDTGGMANLNGFGSRAEIMSRSISMGGKMCARGRLVGNSPGAKAHLECRSIILKDGGSTLAIPELEAHVADVEMTHEAAVGKIARDQIEYLMSRGLDEDQAVSMIVRGFLSGSISGLPEELQNEIDAAIEQANLGD